MMGGSQRMEVTRCPSAASQPAWTPCRRGRMEMSGIARHYPLPCHCGPNAPPGSRPHSRTDWARPSLSLTPLTSKSKHLKRHGNWRPGPATTWLGKGRAVRAHGGSRGRRRVQLMREWTRRGGWCVQVDQQQTSLCRLIRIEISYSYHITYVKQFSFFRFRLLVLHSIIPISNLARRQNASGSVQKVGKRGSNLECSMELKSLKAARG